MSNTYTQLYIHVVFAVKFRRCLIHPEWEAELHKYISGIVQMHQHKMIAINGMTDHIHILVGIKPNQSLSDLVQKIKASFSKWINDNQLTTISFKWQTGYGAFSYSRSQISSVANYIKNQKQHHQKKTMVEEYKEFLQKFEIDYNETYVFHEPAE